MLGSRLEKGRARLAARCVWDYCCGNPTYFSTVLEDDLCCKFLANSILPSKRNTGDAFQDRETTEWGKSHHFHTVSKIGLLNWHACRFSCAMADPSPVTAEVCASIFFKEGKWLSNGSLFVYSINLINIARFQAHSMYRKSNSHLLKSQICTCSPNSQYCRTMNFPSMAFYSSKIHMHLLRSWKIVGTRGLCTENEVKD